MSTTAPTFPQISRSATGTPAAPYIDFETALAAVRDDLPRYLLTPEIAVLLAGCHELFNIHTLAREMSSALSISLA
ncbi:hypothetical protein ACQ86O_18650 [Serratia sp. L9]|uniref:hypothetical protein n=1 Tax=Serratia sp. L9 TaxID=3423946 RepID=UPI003D67F8A3